MTLKIPLELDENDEVHRAHLDAITGYVACASRVVAVTGAGISCSAGIPDFRSADGLYALVKERYPGQVVKGKDLFDAQLFRSAETTSLFLTFASELRRLSLQAQPTPGHQFLETLRQEGRLLRCYTQNIDDLEFRLPIPPSPTLYPKEQSSEIIEETDAEKKREEGVIQLHGTLSKARCTRCAMTRRCTAIELDAWAAGEAPECPYCLDVAAARALANKRTLAIGDLRPDIVLYNEDHPGGAKIAEAIQKDLRKRPDLLLVIGTSLKVHGARQLVKDAAKAVHKAGGISIYVSVTPLSWTEWGSVFDYWIGGPADEWVREVKEGIARGVTSTGKENSLPQRRRQVLKQMTLLGTKLEPVTKASAPPPSPIARSKRPRKRAGVATTPPRKTISSFRTPQKGRGNSLSRKKTPLSSPSPSSSSSCSSSPLDSTPQKSRRTTATSVRTASTMLHTPKKEPCPLSTSPRSSPSPRVRVTRSRTFQARKESAEVEAKERPMPMSPSVRDMLANSPSSPCHA